MAVLDASALYAFGYSGLVNRDTYKSKSMDPIWEQLFSTQEWGKYPPEHVVRFIARNFYAAPKRRDVKLLEVGCGPGANIWYMASEGFDVYGIDGSQTALRTATDRLGKLKLDATLKLGDFCDELPWPDDFFDGVLENLSLYSNRRVRIKRSLSEIHRVLKPGAKFQSCWFDTQTWGYGLGNEVEPNGFEAITEGPLKNRGFCLFLENRDVYDLLKEFSVGAMESLAWSMQDRKRIVSQLVVNAAKPNP